MSVYQDRVLLFAAGEFLNTLGHERHITGHIMVPEHGPSAEQKRLGCLVWGGGSAC